jgi:tetratricopeptide (TPR) repeat protein
VHQLPPPDRFYYDAALGWLMLGDTESALAELRRLGPRARGCACVRELEWGIHAERRDWARAAAVAEEIIQLAPEREFGWVHRAYALRRMEGGGLEQAWAALRPALDRFPNSSTVAYNLACYAAQLGRLEEAWELFARALKAAERPASLICMALADADLEPLWPRIRTTEERCS